MTFSLLARCPETGHFGAIVAGRTLSVGTKAISARAGVGVVATQAGAWPTWRYTLLNSLMHGFTPAEAIARVSTTMEASTAQMAVVGLAGVDVFTGPECAPAAGHVSTSYAARPGRPRVAEGWLCAQGNSLAGQAVWTAMLTGFLGSDGSLVERLAAGLLAGDDAGSDAHGQQSAAVLIVPGDGRISDRHASHMPSGTWDDPFVDLRVDDHPNAVMELARLVQTHLEYRPVIQASSQISHADALLLPT